MGDAFYWIGVVTVSAIGVGALLVGLIWLYANLIHRRIELKMFRKTERRMSIASWHRTRVTYPNDERGEDDWPADDFPINKRPFYFAYRVGGKRLFLMACILSDNRRDSIKGKHP